ncbi:hypothetical protein C8R44DRAFT_882753 [Mycena epipterygia]|nr:hypothetical protein C8R44DRAFT_882753 [Mycena epipterygia]
MQNHTADRVPAPTTQRPASAAGSTEPPAKRAARSLARISLLLVPAPARPVSPPASPPTKPTPRPRVEAHLPPPPPPFACARVGASRPVFPTTSAPAPTRRLPVPASARPGASSAPAHPVTSLSPPRPPHVSPSSVPRLPSSVKPALTQRAA